MYIFLIALLFFPLAPSILSFYWLYKKKQDSVKFRDPKWKYGFYIILTINCLAIAFYAENEKANKAIENNAKQAAIEKSLDKENSDVFENIKTCAENFNQRKNQLTIKNIVSHYEANPDKITKEMMIVVNNTYLQLHKQEQKQFIDLHKSFVTSFCNGYKMNLRIYDQFTNRL